MKIVDTIITTFSNSVAVSELKDVSTKLTGGPQRSIIWLPALRPGKTSFASSVSTALQEA